LRFLTPPPATIDYCGIDLHARTGFLSSGSTLLMYLVKDFCRLSQNLYKLFMRAAMADHLVERHALKILLD
jgi:hypothetical protein